MNHWMLNGFSSIPWISRTHKALPWTAVLGRGFSARSCRGKFIPLQSCDNWDICVTVLLVRYLYKWEGMRAWRVLDKLEVTHLSWDVSIFHLKQLWNIFHPGWWRINPVNVREVHMSWNVARRQEETSQHCDVVATPERDLAAFGNVPRNNEYVKLL